MRHEARPGECPASPFSLPPVAAPPRAGSRGVQFLHTQHAAKWVGTLGKCASHWATHFPYFSDAAAIFFLIALVQTSDPRSGWRYFLSPILPGCSAAPARPESNPACPTSTLLLPIRRFGLRCRRHRPAVPDADL